MSFLLLLACVTALHAQTSDDALVSSLFPPSLDSGRARMYVFARADLDGTGTASYIVAVYCDGIRGDVRVIRPGSTNPVVDEFRLPGMVGDGPHLRLIDLDGDGKPEVIAAFSVMEGQITWPLKWNGAHLALFGPSTTTSAGTIRSLLGYSEFFDIDGDGRPEIIESFTGSPDHIVFALGPDGKYTRLSYRLLYVNRFRRDEGDPELDTGVFRATAGQTVVITVVNGDASGNNRVSGGQFFFNGRLLLSDSDFKKTARTFTLPVVADALNEVEMDLNGKPGTEVTISVAPQQ